jgi:hypothetical protein
MPREEAVAVAAYNYLTLLSFCLIVIPSKATVPKLVVVASFTSKSPTPFIYNPLALAGS